VPPALDSAGPPRQEDSPTESSRSLAREDRWGDEKFAELRALWNRGHASDDTEEAVGLARRAFARACEHGDVDDIIAGAKTWVAAFEAGDGVRFLPQLPVWLSTRGWEKPPPKKRRASGNGKARSNGYAKPDMLEICLEAGGYRKDADGNLFHPGDDGADDDDDVPLRTSMWGGGQ